MALIKNVRTSKRVANALASGGTLLRCAVLAATLIGMHGCMSNFRVSKSDTVQVTSLDEEQGEAPAVPARMSREQLLEEL